MLPRAIDAGVERPGETLFVRVPDTPGGKNRCLAALSVAGGAGMAGTPHNGTLPPRVRPGNSLQSGPGGDQTDPHTAVRACQAVQEDPGTYIGSGGRKCLSS